MIGTQIAKNRYKPQPFKHEVGYPTSVTVCIAAVCQERKQPRIVLCLDTRLDYQDLGSTNINFKLQFLAWGWCAQLAGEWSGVSYLGSLIEAQAKKLQSSPRSISDIEGWVNQALGSFLNSALCKSGKDYQLILSGFIRGLPKLLYVSVSKKKPEIFLGDCFAVIGSGMHIANSLLMLREYEPSVPVQYAAYAAYEAKRCSEKSGDVGRFTVLLIQAPGSPETKDKFVVAMISELGKQNLEGLYKRFWKVPFTHLIGIPEFPSEFYLNPKEKQAPK